ncbi:MAG: transcriptional regulator [Gammaproteobacteria bacterium]|nr:transcriptional regulator [Gammaproteobacteria bacterium]
MVKKQSYIKVVDERYTLPTKKGGGTIRIEAWEDKKGVLVKYNIAYINPQLFSQDNGRVFGYDNAHNYHHKHHMGQIEPVTDFISYENLIERFEVEIKEYIK